jgi:HAD superfamily hydrolase (TIGR01509 family)
MEHDTPKGAKMEWSAAIFDLDGLMIDSEPIALEVWRDIAAEYDREVSEELYREVIGKTPLFGNRLLRSKLDLPLGEDELLTEYWTRRTRMMCERVQPTPGLTKLLELLKGQNVAMAVASNSPRSYMEEVLEELDLARYFACILSSEDVQHGKPAPDIHTATMECLGIEPGEGLVLEDSPAGVKAAKAAGLTCFAVPSEEMMNEDFSEADEIFESLVDVLRRFQELISE